MAENTIGSLKTGQEKCVLETRVYRKWVSKSIPQKKEIAFCCILIDRELSSRVPYLDENSKTVYLRLTDYLGWIRSISDITPFGNANTGQGWLRKVDIENLDGNVVEFTMWDDLAKQFNKEEIEKLSRPIIIAVSSCKVSKYRDLQLSTTSATYYYINPQTLEAKYAYTE
ncbi:DNA helicase [Tanacetum coccineum]